MRAADHAWGHPPVLLLCAGRGRRLGAGASDLPKVLLRFGGRSLLERHLEHLAVAGAGPVTLVVGYRHEAIEAELERLGRTEQVRLIHNPDWREGSVVSLDAGRDVLEAGGPVVLMDGDVLYDRRLLDRLLGSAHPGVLLLDRRPRPGDEPVRVCLDASGRIVDFAKRPEAAYASYGESVGFFRLSGDIAASLSLRAHAAASGDGRMLEYEEPLRALIREDAAAAATPGRSGGAMFGCEDVTGLPWTEIDVMEDVERARSLLPALDGVPA